MFDKTYISTGKSGGSHHSHRHEVTVNEHRAPTDESVRLLNEMEQAAKNNLLNSIVIKDNTLNGVVFYFREDPMLVVGRFKYMAKFKLNGREFRFNGEYEPSNPLEFQSNGKHFICPDILEQLSQKIMYELLPSMAVAYSKKLPY